ncbi:dual specificity protein phosphatase 22 [Petromyzon marinus]|uniref:Dual specificity protein phosphatase 22 n=1 Tax=Petromyzon marinus TaxID=7757 RepID=A0AAJ7XGP3_PETMA|nr:dual specificity protein phosphatase 22 [Petromyzon marinus]
MGNGMNKVLEGLYLGNIKDSADLKQLRDHNITHILSVHDAAREALEEMTYLCIQVSDTPSQNLTQHFKDCIQFIHKCRMEKKGCLVHCLAGVSRSVTMVVAYIMTVTSLGWEEAMVAVKTARTCANPNLGFQQQLQMFQNEQLAETRRWLRAEFGEPSPDDELEARALLARHEQQQQEHRDTRDGAHWPPRGQPYSLHLGSSRPDRDSFH